MMSALVTGLLVTGIFFTTQDYNNTINTNSELS